VYGVEGIGKIDKPHDFDLLEYTGHVCIRREVGHDGTWSGSILVGLNFAPGNVFIDIVTQNFYRFPQRCVHCDRAYSVYRRGTGWFLGREHHSCSVVHLPGNSSLKLHLQVGC
jgi:hypothetical protein